MWVPVYDATATRPARKSNVVYSIDLVRGLDVYSVDVPGDGIGAIPRPRSCRTLARGPRAGRRCCRWA